MRKGWYDIHGQEKPLKVYFAYTALVPYLKQFIAEKLIFSIHLFSLNQKYNTVILEFKRGFRTCATLIQLVIGQ